VDARHAGHTAAAAQPDKPEAMNGFEIKLPVRDPDEPLNTKSIAELPMYVEDADDRAVTRQLLMELLIAGAEDLGITIGLIDETLGALDKSVLRQGLNRLRVAAGLESVEDIPFERQHKMRVPDTRVEELVITPGGAIVSRLDIEDNTAREQARAASLAAQREAQAADQAADIQARRQYEQARHEQLRRETPHGVPIP
jgi:hypothetical protein